MIQAARSKMDLDEPNDSTRPKHAQDQRSKETQP
jgi:hypothetical protein